jgi:hypothetical protein
MASASPTCPAAFAGDTFEDAIDNAAVPLAGHLAVMEADGDGSQKLEVWKS